MAIKELKDPKKKPQDTAVIINADNNTCEILPVWEIDGKLYCDEYVLPISDAGQICVGERGRVFLYNCSLPYLNEVNHLAQVEKNIVLNKALVFKNETQNKTSFFTYFVVAGLMLTMMIAAIAN